MTSFDSPAAIPDTGKLSHIGAADIARVDELLTTTRAVRKRLDLGRPVSPAVIERCIEISLQAPTGSNAQGWHFIVVTDPQKRRELATLYASAFELFSSTYGESGPYPSTDPRARQYSRMKSSATHLMQHMHEVPVLVVPCIEGRCETAGVMVQASLYGSILPAVWSFILALRVRGLGTCWTTDHLLYEADAAAVLGVPEHVTQVALLPVAYFTGARFKPAKRLPALQCTHWNSWGAQR